MKLCIYSGGCVFILVFQKLKGILTVLRCIFLPNLEILPWLGGDLSCGQAQNEANFDFKVEFVLEGQGQWPHKIGILTKVFCTSDPNMVILPLTGDELLPEQAHDYPTHRQVDGRTDTQSDAGNDNTQRPKLASGNDTTEHFMKQIHFDKEIWYNSEHNQITTSNHIILRDIHKHPIQVFCLGWFSRSVTDMRGFPHSGFPEISHMYVILTRKETKVTQGSKFHSSDRLRRVKMTVRQVEYLQDLSDGRLHISDFHISYIGFIYFRQVNDTFGQVIFTIHLPDGQVYSIWNFKVCYICIFLLYIFFHTLTCVMPV